jgi:tRNA(fMet)-specific endonuclease VapC
MTATSSYLSYLVDSDIVADWLQGRSQAVQLLSSLEPQGLAISLITYGEIYEGVLYSRDPKASERIFRRFMRDVTILPVNKVVMKRFAYLRGQLRGAGSLIADFDLLIAATAIEYQLTLITRNIRHFDRVPGLSLYQPSQ